MGDTSVVLHPLGALMRRFALDWLDRADASVPAEIMASGYTILIGGYALEGREAYVEATSGQLARFPGLTITIHDAVYTPGGRAALRFTEHGASARGGAAAWRGIGLFRTEGGVLVHNACEEDYVSRRRQLRDGVTDPVDPPMVAPWTEPPAEPDADAEKAVRAWLDDGALLGPGLVVDDGSPAEPLLDAAGCDVDECFAAGRRVAFHATLHGRYAGGLPGADAEPVPAAPGSPDAATASSETSAVSGDTVATRGGRGERGGGATLGIAGLVDVAADGTLTGHVVRDRLGLLRALGR